MLAIANWAGMPVAAWPGQGSLGEPEGEGDRVSRLGALPPRRRAGAGSAVRHNSPGPLRYPPARVSGGQPLTAKSFGGF